MTDEAPEYSDGGSQIYRHQGKDGPMVPPQQDGQAIELLEAHIGQYVPGEGTVFHELVSNKVHIDVHIRNPNAQRDYYTLVTTGMSDKPMQPPVGAESYRHSELVICLPASWRLTQDAFSEEANYWPIRWLKTLARLPHDYDTWLWVDHTVPNGDPAQPFASNTKLCGMIVATPTKFGDGFLKVRVNDAKTVYFNSIIPLFQEEMAYKLKSGAVALFELLEKNGVTELLNPKRKSVIQKKGLFGAYRWE